MDSKMLWTSFRLADTTSWLSAGNTVQDTLYSVSSGMLTRYGCRLDDPCF